MFLRYSNTHTEFTGKDLFEIRNLKIWFNGYFFIDDIYYTQQKAASYLGEIYKNNTLKNNIDSCNGVFTVIIYNKDTNSVCIANDRFGFGQVFYRINNNEVLFGNNFWTLVKNTNNPTLDKTAVNEFTSCRYVFGGQTLVEGITDILPASIYNFEFKINELKHSRHEYWFFRYTPKPIEKNEAEKIVFNTLDYIIKNYSKTIYRDKNIGLNLTGGIDSRFLLSLMLNNNIPKESISCFTFGDSYSQDIRIANQVSSFTGTKLTTSEFKYPFFDYFEQSTIDRLTKEIGYSCFYFQAYGVDKLAKHYKFQNIDYLITGADGFFVGLMTDEKLHAIKSKEELINYIYLKNATILNSEQKKHILHQQYLLQEDEIKNSIANGLNPDLDFVSNFYNWTIKHRLRKYILSIYEILNRNTTILFPFYDYKFIDLMASLPFDSLINQHAYVNAMYKYAYVDKMEKLTEIPIEKRFIEKQDESFSLHLQKEPLFNKIIRKALSLPEKNYTYTLFGTYKQNKKQTTELIEKLLYSDSKVYRKQEVLSLLSKNKNNEHFFRYGIGDILGLAAFERLINENNI